MEMSLGLLCLLFNFAFSAPSAVSSFSYPQIGAPARNPAGSVLRTGQQRSCFMQTRIGLVAAVLIAGAALTSPLVAPAAQAARGVEPGSSTLDDQVDLAVTVYNSD